MGILGVGFILLSEQKTTHTPDEQYYNYSTYPILVRVVRVEKDLTPIGAHTYEYVLTTKQMVSELGLVLSTNGVRTSILIVPANNSTTTTTVLTNNIRVVREWDHAASLVQTTPCVRFVLRDPGTTFVCSSSPGGQVTDIAAETLVYTVCLYALEAAERMCRMHCRACLFALFRYLCTNSKGGDLAQTGRRRTR